MTGSGPLWRSLVASGVSLLLLWVGLAAGISIAIGVVDALDLHAPHDSNKDPRVIVMFVLIAGFPIPAALFRRVFRIPALVKWPRVAFTAIATAGSIGVVWCYVAFAVSALPMADIMRDSMGRLADLSDLSSRWNAGATLLCAVIFWIAGFAVASNTALEIWQRRRD